MSLWKFGNFEAEIDFTDADFLDRLDEAKKVLNKHVERVPKVGKRSDIVRAQCACYYAFFDTLFYEGASNELFDGRNSLELCVRCADSIYNHEKKEDERIKQEYGKYYVQNHGNRQQRRNYQKNNKGNYKKQG